MSTPVPRNRLAQWIEYRLPIFSWTNAQLIDYPTPHIVPEWYFLPHYAILRAIPDKLGGVVAMLAAVMILFFMPWLDNSKVRSARFRPIYKQFFWVFLADCVVLGWVGANPPAGSFILIGRLATAYYFAHFIIIVPLIARFERPRALPESIHQAVLKKGGGGDPAPAPAAKMEQP